VDIDRVELWVQWNDVAGREARLEQVLRAIPGVASLELIRPDDTTAEARVRVAFDPGRTNPVVIEEALGREGFTVLSAGERPSESGRPG
jgi:hypothetical protein